MAQRYCSQLRWKLRDRAQSFVSSFLLFFTCNLRLSKPVNWLMLLVSPAVSSARIERYGRSSSTRQSHNKQV